MSQGNVFLPTVGVYNGLTAANTLNTALDAILTSNKGSTTPANGLGSVAKAGQFWLDDSVATLQVLKQFDGADWIVIGYLDTTNNIWTPANTAPIETMAAVNLAGNPGMEVSQENGTSSVAYATGAFQKYVVDQWQIAKIGTMVLAAQQVTDAPPGFANSLKVTVGTAQGSLGTTDIVSIGTAIEGCDSAHLGFGAAGAQPITLAFWTKIHRTGAYSGSIRNSAANRSYPFSFTQNVADTWEYKTVTIPGDVTGTWLNGTGVIGLSIAFMVAAGSSIVTTAGAWAAGTFTGVTGTTNGVAATSDVFQIVVAGILPGSYAPSAAKSSLLLRPYSEEYRRCLRYLYVLAPGVANADVAAGGVSGTVGYFPILWPVPMCKTPTTPTMSAAADWNVNPFSSGSTQQNGTSVAFAATSKVGTRVQLTTSSTGAAQGTMAALETTNTSANIIVRAQL